jgi:hypothetical protein
MNNGADRVLYLMLGLLFLLAFFWIGFLAVVPYLALVAYGAYGCPEQNLKTKYNAKW